MTYRNRPGYTKSFLESLTDAFTATATSLLEKGKANKSDSAILKEAINDLGTLSVVYKSIWYRVSQKFDFELELMKYNSTEQIIEIIKAKDPEAIKAAKKVLEFTKVAHTLNLMNEDASDLSNFSRLELEVMLIKIGTILNYIASRH